MNLSEDKNRDVDRMYEAARNAVRADNDDHVAHEALGRAHLWQKRYGDALAEYEKALALNPVSGKGHYGYGVTLLHSGDAAKAEAEFNAAIQLSPRDPYRSAFYSRMAYCQIALGYYASAVDWARKSMSEPFTEITVYLFLVAALGHLEREAELKDAVNEMFARIPDASLNYVREQIPSVPDTLESLLEGLRKAGIPDGGSAATEPATNADKPSIAVLPFDNLSGDAEQEYFSDGMAEDLITDLSKISGLAVAARNSSFSFKGQMPDVREVAEKLGVKFVLEGSVRKMGERLRINAQLIAAADGNHLWAERYDGDMAEIFDFQDRIREEIVAALALQLTPADEARSGRSRTVNVEAYDLYLRGRAEYYRYTPDHIANAETYLTRAIEADPELAEAYAYLSRCITGKWIQRWPGHDETVDRAIELAERAVALDGASALGFTMLGWAQNFAGLFERSKENFERAISLDSNNPEAHATYALANAFWGDPENTLAVFDRALEIDPLGHPNADFLFGQCHYLSGRLDEAATIFEKVIDKRPGFMPARVHLAATLVAMDRIDDARQAVKETLEERPGLTLADTKKIFPYRREEDRDRFFGALQKAGLPESAGPETSVKSGALAAPPPLPDKPSIAVLPFDNLSGDPEQEYFSDGISEDIITALSRIRQFFVIARNTTFTYKGRAVDVQAIAKDLGVRYVLEGSVRKSGERVRITAQLIDGETGNHIWAEKYDRDLKDIFAVQDEITLTVVGAIGPALGRAEQDRARRKPPGSLDAWDYYQQAMQHVWRPGKADTEEATRLLNLALEHDPDFCAAHAYLTFQMFKNNTFGYADHETNKKEILAAGKAALAADDQDALAHYAMGNAHMVERDFAAAIDALGRAIEINPSFAAAYHEQAAAYTLTGRHGAAIEGVMTALRLSPSDPGRWAMMMIAGMTHFRAGDYAAAADWSRRSTQQPNASASPHVFLIGSLGHLGMVDEAAAAIEKYRESFPDHDVESNFNHSPFLRDEAEAASMREGLDKAGL